LIAIGTSAFGTITFSLALRRIPATQAAAWAFLVPAVAVVIEAVRGDRPDAIALIGMALAIAGVAVANLAPAMRRQRGDQRDNATSARYPIGRLTLSEQPTGTNSWGCNLSRPIVGCPGSSVGLIMIP
jgi:hypothetical protein